MRGSVSPVSSSSSTPSSNSNNSSASSSTPTPPSTSAPPADGVRSTPSFKFQIKTGKVCYECTLQDRATYERQKMAQSEQADHGEQVEHAASSDASSFPSSPTATE